MIVEIVALIITVFVIAIVVIAFLTYPMIAPIIGIIIVCFALFFGIGLALSWLRAYLYKSTIEVTQANEQGNYSRVVDLRNKTDFGPNPGISYAPVYHTYAPRIVNDSISQVLPDVASSSVIPTFKDLYTNKQITNNQDLILGWDLDTQNLIRGNLSRLNSFFIAGTAGTGKSTTAAMLIMQMVLKGTKVILIDPHLEVPEESLAAKLEGVKSSFLFPPSNKKSDIEDFIKFINKEASNRLSGISKDYYPILFVVDEFTAIAGDKTLAKGITSTIEMINIQTRKVNIFALVLGQIWTVNKTGGSSVRDSFSSSYVHRLHKNQARTLVSGNDLKLVPRLETGKALFYDSNGVSHNVAIPFVSSQDIADIGFSTPIDGEYTELPEIKKSTNLTDEESFYLSMFLAGASIQDIVTKYLEIKEVKSFQEKALNLQETLRKALSAKTD